MKKAFGIFVIFISLVVLKAQALEDYILFSEKPIKKIESTNSEILTTNILTTIMNEKNTIILRSNNKGKTVLKITIGNEIFEIPVEVKENKTVFKNKYEDFMFIKTDTPPELLEIDLPPKFGGRR